MRKQDFYRKCGELLQRVMNRQVSAKKACFSTKNPRQYYSILCSIIRNYRYLESMLPLEISRLCPSRYVSIVSMYCFLAKKHKHDKNLVRFQKNEFVVPKTFIRINPLRPAKELNLETRTTVVPNVFELLGTFNYKCPFYSSGAYFVQNLASCFPAFILDPPKNTGIMDTCASPGNKTTHLAAVTEDTGTIYAVEKDKERFKILEEMVGKSGALNVKVINSDFLSLDPQVFEDVEYALVDPSCSGSGVHEMFDQDMKRLLRLQGFQIRVICHLAKFKNLKRFVYSTCSVFPEENEEVVKRVLETRKDLRLDAIKDFWSIRGDPKYSFWKKVIRCYPDPELGTIGFFAALFSKIG